MKDNTTRRNVAKLLGSSLGVLSIGSVGSAKKKNQSVREQARNLFENSNLSEAENIMDDAGVQYFSGRDTPPSGIGVPTNENNHNPAPDDYFSKNNSVNTLLQSLSESGKWYFGMNWDLSRNDDIDGPEPTDALILAWDGSHFKHSPIL